VKQKNPHLSESEQHTIDRIEALSELLKSVPPMTVEIRGGSTAFTQVIGRTALCPLGALVERVRNECPRWQEPHQLTHYLDAVIAPQVHEERSRLEERYEILVQQPLLSDMLSFVEGEMRKSSLPNLDPSPRIEFDTPSDFSLREVLALRIYPTGYSERDEFVDSKFEVHQKENTDSFIVRRMRCSIQELQVTHHMVEQRKLQAEWLQSFEYAL
jgi:hypothetical protein